MNFNILMYLFLLMLIMYLYMFISDTSLMTFLLILIFFIYILNNFWFKNFFEMSEWKLLFSSLLILSFMIIILTLKDLSLEIMFLYFIVYLGAILILYSDNLLMMYLGIELQTFSLFILIGKNKYSIKGSEASLKYFMLGSLSSGIYLLGLSLLFFNNMELSMNNLLFFNNYNSSLYYIPGLLMLMSWLFKLAIFPFHFWIPDIYEGSTWDMVGLLAMIPKISMISVMMKLYCFSDFYLICGLLSMVMGTVGTLNQTKLKSFLAYSGISHIGFIVLGLGFLSHSGCESSLVYLYIYIISSLIMFLLMLSLSFSSNVYLMELGNKNINNKMLSLTWLVLMLSMGAMPPLSGFISKWYIFNMALNESYYLSLFFSMIFSIIALGYYLSMVKMLYFQKNSSYMMWNSILKKKTMNYNIHLYLMGLGLYFTIFFMMNPSPLFYFMNLNLFNFF